MKRNIEASRGDVGAAQADADAVRVAIVAATTRAYVDAAAAAERLAVATVSWRCSTRAPNLTGKRVDAGRAAPLDTDAHHHAARSARGTIVPALRRIATRPCSASPR